MNMQRGKTTAIVTVVSDNYLQGALVLFHSFLTHNPWFNGDLVVIDGGLSETSRQILSARFAVIYHQPGAAIEQRLAALTAVLPKYEQTRKRFYSLELFALRGYEQVLHLDSDMLCLGNVQDLFEGGYRLAVCTDLPWFYECIRVKRTWETMKIADVANPPVEPMLERTFNTGLLLVSGSLLTEEVYAQLLLLLTPATFESIVTGHTDSIILNQYFEQGITQLPATYNFYPVLTGMTQFDDIKPYFIHFVGKVKPWMPNVLPTTWQRAWHNAATALEAV